MPDALTQKAEQIFYDVQDVKNIAERIAFMERACDGNAALRIKVEQMLATQKNAESFFLRSSLALEPPVEATPMSPDGSSDSRSPGWVSDLDEKPGTCIGSYKLNQKIGEGGCGAVYMAEQEEPVRRRVALKIIKLGMDTRNVIARFRAEQQALALMDHPNIAQVHDAGVTDKGRPYFIMELVRGIKLTTYCDQHLLDARQRMGLFIQVCHAIQHAHQKGIIHRDIKPSNILVTMHDGAPVPKVIDFGIAKAVEGKLADETNFTAYDQFVGTPAYMSPEQAGMSALDVDTRSDIYSLGVLLYELLTGKTPFDTNVLLQGGVDELRRTLRECEPQRPSAAVATLQADDLTKTAQCRRAEPMKLISLLRGDLDWIVMKALEKDRNRRYQTANGLALDVQRYLDNEPILARPPSQFYRFQKLVRRNKILFAAGSITVMALIVSSGVSTWLLVKERVARQRALLAEQQKGSLEKEASLLRENVEKRRKLSEALTLYQQGKNESADAILNLLPNPPVAMEYASMYRGLGDWHASNDRWAKAKARFEVLTLINELQGGDTTLDDYRSAVLLVSQGYLQDYERFRESLITRYAGTVNPTVAQRILRICLLTPANEELLNGLDRFSVTVENSLSATKPGQGSSGDIWQSYAIALMTYRRGEYDETLNWCQHTKVSNTGFPTRDFSIQLIQAMARKQLEQDEAAQAELDACRAALIKTTSTKTAVKDWQGFWFDKTCVQIHLCEATELIEGGKFGKPN